MKRILLRLLSFLNLNSLPLRMRRKRFSLFVDMIQRNARTPLYILDVGGTEMFWESMGFTESGNYITLLNLVQFECKCKNISSVVGNACKMDQFADNQFDIVFSNSVIEHLGTLEDQKKMAQEVRRIAKTYFLQTPNYYFPIEPHFMVPFFHWLPIPVRKWLIGHFSLGSYARVNNDEEAERFVKEIRLMKYYELKKLFPGASIVRERFFGLTKSFLVSKTMSTIS